MGVSESLSKMKSVAQTLAEKPGNQSEHCMHHFEVVSSSWPLGQNRPPRNLLFSNFSGKRPTMMLRGKTVPRRAQRPLWPESCRRRAVTQSRGQKKKAEAHDAKAVKAGIAVPKVNATAGRPVPNNWNHQNSALEAVKSHEKYFLKQIAIACWKVICQVFSFRKLN